MKNNLETVMPDRSQANAKFLHHFITKKIVLLFFLLISSYLAYSQCPGSQTFNSDGTWTAPATGGPFEVQITCNGAGGGACIGFGNNGGNGAQTIGTFAVNDGETINIIVGVAGINGTSNGGEELEVGRLQ